MAASIQGECAALLRRNELGSIPRLPAIYRRVLVNDNGSNPLKESSILLRRCQSCVASQTVRALVATQMIRGSIPRRRSNFGGGMREQANPAGREPASDRIDTDMSRHAGIAQPGRAPAL